MKPTTVRQFFQQFPDDETCLAQLFETRFGQGHVCPKCERSARWYPLKSESAFSCQWCGHHIHPMVGTLFEKSRTPLQLWFYAMFLFTKTRHGVSAKELERQLGVTYKCAFRMAHRIRKHMAMIDGDEALGGPGEIVQVDEAYVGGARRGSPGRGARGKTIVVGMAEAAEGGRITATVVPNVRQSTIHGVITDNIAKGSEIHADMNNAYNNLDEKGYDLRRINKDRDGFSLDGVDVNSVENFWRHLKMSINGTHTSVSPKHLEKYVKEFQYRFNRRTTPEKMFRELLKRFPDLNAHE